MKNYGKKNKIDVSIMDNNLCVWIGHFNHISHPNGIGTALNKQEGYNLLHQLEKQIKKLK